MSFLEGESNVWLPGTVCFPPVQGRIVGGRPLTHEEAVMSLIRPDADEVIAGLSATVDARIGALGLYASAATDDLENFRPTNPLSEDFHTAGVRRDGPPLPVDAQGNIIVDGRLQWQV